MYCTSLGREKEKYNEHKRKSQPRGAFFFGVAAAFSLKPIKIQFLVLLAIFPLKQIL